ncbi:uncharacterized protein MJAP1_001866 [Malassezia japonica]|uniref:Uncharacterized protein n=1 Tax=Malassezia japonica TaxID=223818 RepID=A0AAF0F173_9BASI|nr:uncharacterized protein MJAP1_001866 [Malassezia japonica]WFD38900.1 hypothetical protein MJAP1_001866 [Malassezia japonica]
MFITAFKPNLERSKFKELDCIIELEGLESLELEWPQCLELEGIEELECFIELEELDFDELNDELAGDELTGDELDDDELAGDDELGDELDDELTGNDDEDEGSHAGAPRRLSVGSHAEAEAEDDTVDDDGEAEPDGELEVLEELECFMELESPPGLFDDECSELECSKLECFELDGLECSELECFKLDGLECSELEGLDELDVDELDDEVGSHPGTPWRRSDGSHAGAKDDDDELDKDLEADLDKLSDEGVTELVEDSEIGMGMGTPFEEIDEADDVLDGDLE